VTTMVLNLPYLTVWTATASRTLSTHDYPTLHSAIDAELVSMGADQVLLSPIHAYYHNIEQINGGRNDMFGGHVDGRRLHHGLFRWQPHEAVAMGEGVHPRGQFFMGAFGGSYLNHLWLICACTQHTRMHRRACGPSSMRTVG